MTSVYEFASAVTVRVNGKIAAQRELAIYSARFGRSPIDPMVLFVLRTQAP